MKHASEKLWHVAVHAPHAFVMCVRLRVGGQSGVTLGALRVVVLFPLHGPTLATMHLVTAQTTHAPFETGALRLSRAIVVEAGKTSVGEKARAIVVLRNGYCAKRNSRIVVDRVAPGVLVVAAAAGRQDPFGIKVFLRLQQPSRRPITCG